MLDLDDLLIFNGVGNCIGKKHTMASKDILSRHSLSLPLFLSHDKIANTFNSYDSALFFAISKKNQLFVIGRAKVSKFQKDVKLKAMEKRVGQVDPCGHSAL